MKSYRFALSLMLCIAGCALQEPIAPALAPQIVVVPASLTITSGPATSANESLLTVTVLDVAGRGVPGQTIVLSTTAGTLNYSAVMTSQAGTAQAILTTTRTATVTAQAGSLTNTITAVAYSLSLFASIAATPTNPRKGDTVTFTAMVSGGTAPLTYAWAFGDGTGGAGQTTNHRYVSDGSKQIALAVTDADGHADSAFTILTVQPDLVPTPTCAIDPSLCPEQPSLAAVLTCTPGNHAPPNISFCNLTPTYGGATLPGASITNVNWDWADGTVADNNSAGPTKSHQYLVAGSYTVFATVTADLPAPPGGNDTVRVSKALTVP